jgi:LmbE family N-acetylglucosaminyl deacetylase
MNVVCIGAHQDDIELNCGGTLLRYYRRGDLSLTNVVISNGDKGAQYDISVPYEEVARIRNAEAAAAAARLGGCYINLGQSDEYIRDTDAARDQLTDILREAGAEIVLTCAPADYNTDHIVAGQLAFHACLLAPVRTVFTEHGPLPASPAMYYWDTATGLDWQPTHYVDISDVFQEKCDILSLYASQMRNMEQFGGWDLVSYARIANAYRGLQCGVAYAEAFRPCLAWPRLRPGNWLP